MLGYQPRTSLETNSSSIDEQIRLLMRGRIDLPTNVFAAAIVSYLLWPKYPPEIVLGWLTVFYLVIAVRALLRHRFWKAELDDKAMRRWGRIFTINAAATASLWGLIGSVVLVTPDPVYHNFAVFVLGGIMAAGVVSNSAYMPTMIAFQVPIIAPIVLLLYSKFDAVSVVMGTMLAVFAALMVGTGGRINRSIIENFALRLEQRALLEARLKEAAASAALAAIVADSDDAIMSETLEGEILSWNHSAERLFGYRAAEMIGRNAKANIPPDRAQEFGDKRGMLTRGERIEPFDTERLAKDGSRIPVSMAISPYFDPDGTLIGASFIARSIADRLEADRILAYRDHLLNGITVASALLVKAESLDVTMVEALGILGDAMTIDRVIVMQQDPEIRVLYIWQRPGVLPVVDASFYTLAAADIPAIAVWREVLNSGQPLIANCATSSGAVQQLMERFGVQSMLAVPIMSSTRLWGNLGVDSCTAVRDWTPYEIRVLKIFGEIVGSLITRHKAATALDESLRRFRSVTTAAQDAIVTIDAANRIEMWNPAAERLLGYTAAEAIGRPVVDLAAAPFKASLAMILASFDVSGEIPSPGHTTEMVAVNKNGAEIAVEVSLSSTRLNGGWGGVGIVRDITERKTSEAKLAFSRTLLKSQMEASRSGILVVDTELKAVMHNQRFIDMWHLSVEQLAGVTLPGLLALAKPLLAEPGPFLADAMALVGHREVDRVDEYPLNDGRIVTRDIRRLSALDGAYLGRVIYFNDVTEERGAAARLQFANLLLKTQMEASLDGILIVDAGLKIIAFNQRFADIWHIPLTDLEKGDDTVVLAKVVQMVKEKDKFAAGVQYLYDNVGEDRHEEFETNDGRSIERYAVALSADGGKYLGRAWFFRDITERKQAAAYALRMSRYDILTGLANRAVFIEALQHAIAAAKRGEKSFAVVYLDLDHFKDINDTLGHPAGDELLKQIAAVLMATTRVTDTVARFGGDEFAVIVSDIRDPADAAIMARKLNEAISVPFHVQGNDVHSGASIGIAMYGQDEPDAETLLSQADIALYRAKSEGRGGYRFFTDAMDSEVQSRVKLGGELREAIDAGQLFLMYQPQVEIESGRINGVEALVRWQHPEHGVLGPDTFIPLAEQIGIIARLGHWVLWAACRQARVWLDAKIPPVRMAVNFSALQFKAPIAIEADINAALAETRLPPNLLELEFTESVLMVVSGEHSDVLQRLRAAGVTIAIDDFGTGYSSLGYLRRFPANRIKIAQIFVRDLETNADDAAIIRATIGLARELGIDVIAEGVETPAQAKLVAGWGCTEAQGFLFSRPLSLEDCTAALRLGHVAMHIGA